MRAHIQQRAKEYNIDDTLEPYQMLMGLRQKMSASNEDKKDSNTQTKRVLPCGHQVLPRQKRRRIRKTKQKRGPKL